MNTADVSIQDKPIPGRKRQNFRYFLGLFSGEHVAGTEFVIGATFVLWGVAAGDVFLGLLIGNALAVLSWVLLCAPIAVQTRLTMYAYLKQISGINIQWAYNLLNGLYCVIVAAAMMTVSASAVRIFFSIPPQTGWLPSSLSFVLVVLVLGIIMTVISAYGFKLVARTTSLCAPWLLVVFFTGGLIALFQIGELTGVGIVSSVNEFMTLANTYVWIDNAPNTENLTIYHVIAFAWITNFLNHVGLMDMALFRFAKNYKYAYASASGMFLGHFFAWICAGFMGAATALIINESLQNIDSGELAYQVLGTMGIIGVVIAGWTTASPTLYRAGLAFQTIFSKTSVPKVTLLTGFSTAIIACFPFVFTAYTEIVGFTAMVLGPVGAMIIIEHWGFEKMGLTRYWSMYKQQRTNIPMLISWIISVAFGLTAVLSDWIHLYFLSFLTSIVAIILYPLIARFAGAHLLYRYAEQEAEELKMEIEREGVLTARDEALKAAAESDPPQKANWLTYTSGVLALGSLLVLVGGAVSVFLHWLDIDLYLTIALYTSIAYFITAFTWAKRGYEQES